MTEPSRMRRCWRVSLRWSRRLVIVAVVGALLARVTLALWLPSAVEAAVQDSGFAIRYEDFDLSLLGGDVELRHVEVALESGELIGHVEYARVDIDISGFFFLDLRVHRIEADGVDVTLRRGPDGSWNLPRSAGAAEAEAVETTEVADVAADAPFDLSSPVQLDALRVQHARIRIVDEVKNRDSTLEVNFRVSDIGHPSRRARIALQVASEDLRDAVSLEGFASLRTERAQVDLELRSQGQHGGVLAHASATAGLWNAKQVLTAGASLRVDLESSQKRRRLSGSVSVDGAHLEVDGVEGVGDARIVVQASVEPARTDLGLAACHATLDLVQLAAPLEDSGFVGIERAAEFSAAGDLSIEPNGDALRLHGGLRDVWLRSDRSWFELGAAECSMRITPDGTVVESALLEGLDLPLRREGDDRLAFLGLASVAVTAGESVSVADVSVPEEPAEHHPQRFAIDSLEVRDSRVRWIDDRIDGGEITVNVVGEVSEFEIGDASDRPATLGFSLASPQLGAIRFDGSARSRAAGLDLSIETELRAERIDTTALVSWLGPDGLVTGLNFRSVLDVDLRRAVDDLIVQAAMRNASLVIAEREVGSMAALTVAESRFGPSTSIGEVAIEGGVWNVDDEHALRWDALLDGFAEQRSNAFEINLATTTDDTAKLGGTFDLGGGDASARFALESEFTGDGVALRALPPNVVAAFGRATVAAGFELSSASVPEGGRSVNVAMREFGMRVDELQDPVFAIREFALDVPRLDTEAGVIDVRECAARGVVLDAVIGERSSEVAALRFAPTTAEPDPEPGGQPDPSTDEVRSAPLPAITLGDFAIEFDRLRVGESGGEPLELRWAVRNTRPLALAGPDPESLPPLALEFVASEPAALEELKVVISAAPWHLQPSVELSVAARGVHGEPINAAMPNTTAGIDLAAIDAGSFSAGFESRLELRRREPTSFDVSSGFGVEAHLHDVTFRADENGAIVAGVESVFVDAPRLGGRGVTHVREVSIHGVRGAAHVDPDGFVFAGVRFPVAADAVGVVEASDTLADTEIGQPLPEPAKPLRIDRLQLQGLSFDFADNTCEPPLNLPVTDATLTVDGLRTGVPSPPPVHIEFSMRAGSVELPKRTKASSAIAGLLSSAGAALVGGSDDSKTEQRPVFEELSVRGTVTPSSPLQGSVVADLAAFELLAVRGMALASGVEIGDGVLDGRVEVNFEASGRTATSTKIRFTDLVIDEPPGGPISTYLKLPAPLQTVLFVLKDDEDEINIPIDVAVESDGGVSLGAIATEAAAALGSVVTDAIASSPFRVAGIATGLFAGDDEDEFANAARALEYEGGQISVPYDALDQLSQLCDLADDDEVVIVIEPILGESDLAIADSRAMPSEDDRLAILSFLRSEKVALWREHEVVSARASALRRLGRDPADERASLGEIEASIADRELAIDEIAALLRPGIERRSARRAKRFAVEIATARAHTLRDALADEFGSDFATRVEVRRPRLPSTRIDRGVLGVTLRRRAN